MRWKETVNTVHNSHKQKDIIIKPIELWQDTKSHANIQTIHHIHAVMQNNNHQLAWSYELFSQLLYGM